MPTGNSKSLLLAVRAAEHFFFHNILHLQYFFQLYVECCSFGAGLTSKQTGIILNSVMDDFSFPYFRNYFNLPGSPNNALQPGKRPLSSMSPSILVDRDGDAKVVIGASGGTKITTAVALVSVQWHNNNNK
jgi:gamma-glutamyltranspeptidase/glutathione hydrolase/leukotriene-C4 hydrolase